MAKLLHYLADDLAAATLRHGGRHPGREQRPVKTSAISLF